VKTQSRPGTKWINTRGMDLMKDWKTISDDEFRKTRAMHNSMIKVILLLRRLGVKV
jgi:hypothetical protein